MHPAVAGGLIDSEGKVAGAQARMSAFLDVFLRATKTIDQEITKTLLCVLKFVTRIHGAEDIVLRDLAVEGGLQAREAFLSDD